MKKEINTLTENYFLEMKNNIILLLFALIFLSSCDKEKNRLRKGNDLYQEKDYVKSEEQYRKSLVADSNYLKAQYNLANASYKQSSQEKLQTAMKYYESYLKGNSYTDTINNANAIYNRGNVNFQLFNTDTANAKIEYLEKALEDYKQTLRLNPGDSAAKYNLALTQYLLDKNKNQEQNQDNQQQQQQNQSQDKKQEEQKDENTPPQPQRMQDKKDMERMLEALKNNEKNTLEKVKKKEEQQVQKRYIEKDW